MSRHIKYYDLGPPERAPELTRTIYRQMKRELGVTPQPLTLHSPSAELLAGVWNIFRETLLTGEVRRGTKEAVAAAVSDINRCPWCVDAHTSMLYASAEPGAADAILRHNESARGKKGYYGKDGQSRNGGDGNGSSGSSDGPEIASGLRDVIRWARAGRTPGAPILLDPPFPAESAPEMIGTAVTFHYLNRMVSALLSETFMPGGPWLKGVLRKVGGLAFRSLARAVHPPGEALGLLPEAALPADLVWAEGAPHIAGAFARFSAAVERAGEQALPPEVRALVAASVQSWDGTEPGMSTRWVEEAIQPLSGERQSAGRLALLAALAPYRIDEHAVKEFRLYRQETSVLIGALAWASFAAARRVGTWLAVGSSGEARDTFTGAAGVTATIAKC
jgi:AhpD family alkylhydroperoxidase